MGGFYIAVPPVFPPQISWLKFVWKKPNLCRDTISAKQTTRQRNGVKRNCLSRPFLCRVLAADILGKGATENAAKSYCFPRVVCRGEHSAKKSSTNLFFTVASSPSNTLGEGQVLHSTRGVACQVPTWLSTSLRWSVCRVFFVVVAESCGFAEYWDRVISAKLLFAELAWLRRVFSIVRRRRSVRRVVPVF